MNKRFKIKKTRNEGRKLKIAGVEYEIDKVLADGKFRVKQGEGGVVVDYDLSDVEKAEELIVEIK